MHTLFDYQGLPENKKSLFRSYKSKFIKQGLKEEEAMERAMAKIKTHPSHPLASFAPDGATNCKYLGSVAAIAFKACAFLLFLSILIAMGLKADPHNLSMIIMTELMALVGLCWPMRLSHPFWLASNGPWWVLRCAGGLAVCLSWSMLDAGLQKGVAAKVQHSEMLQSYRKAIATSWDDLHSLPLSYRTKRSELRHQILSLEEKLQVSPAAESLEQFGLNMRLYRILVLIFTLVTGHWLASGLRPLMLR